MNEIDPPQLSELGIDVRIFELMEWCRSEINMMMSPTAQDVWEWRIESERHAQRRAPNTS